MTASKLIYLLTVIHWASANSIPWDDLLKPNGCELENGITNNATSSSVKIECQNDDDCTMNDSKCLQMSCSCLAGFTLDGTLTRCLKVATSYNDDCEESSQCSQFLLAGGTCEDGVCICKDGFHYFHGRCHKSKGLNELCKQNEECFVIAEYGAASCKNGSCQCSEGYYQREYSTCRRKAKVGDNCLLDSDCFFDKSVKCASNKCVLKNNEENNTLFDKKASFKGHYGYDFIYEESKLISVGSSCTTDKDCASLINSHCGNNNSCICNRAHFASEKSDFCIPEIGESCDPSDESLINFTVCLNGVWACDYDKINLKNNRECTQRKKINEGCTTREQCQLFGPRADCMGLVTYAKKTQCQCNSSSHWLESESFCWINRGIGESCKSDNDCHPRGQSPQTVCNLSTKVCSCPEGTHEDSDGDYCINDWPVLGNYCEKDDDCGIENSKCYNQECKCKETYFEFEGSCLKGLNATCKVDNDCDLNNTFCSNENVCQCKENFVKSPENECIAMSSYQKPCKYDIQCSVVTFNTYCFFEAKPEEESADEFTEEEEFGSCECQPEHFYNMNACYKKKLLGEECSREGECFVESSKSFCRNGKCSCDFKHRQEGKKCVKMDGNTAPSIVSIHHSFLITASIFLTLKVLH